MYISVYIRIYIGFPPNYIPAKFNYNIPRYISMYMYIAARMSNFNITIGNVTDVYQNPVVYSHGEPAVPTSGNLTRILDPPQYGSVVGFTRWDEGYEVYAISLCEVVVMGTTVVGQKVLMFPSFLDIFTFYITELGKTFVGTEKGLYSAKIRHSYINV